MVWLAVGTFGPSIGGPFQTIAAYAAALEREGRVVKVVSWRALEDGRDGRVLSLDGSPLALLRFAWRTRQSTVCVFGVWHQMFFGLAVLRAIAGRRVVSGRRILIPTNSLTVWDWRKHPLAKRILRPLVSALLRQLDSIVFSSYGEADLSRPAPSEEQRQVVPHPMLRRPRVGRDDSFESPRVVFFGRIAKQKDIPLFLRAVACLPDSWSADVIGDGDGQLVEEARHLAESLNVSSRIRWHGWCTREESWRVLRGATALLVTSYEENYCHAAVEAMALGVPVVIVDRTAASTDMRMRSIASIVDPEPETLAVAAKEFHADLSYRREIVRRALRFAHDRHTPLGWSAAAQAIVGDAGR